MYTACPSPKHCALLYSSSSNTSLRTSNNLATQKSRTLVRKVLDIIHNSRHSIRSQGFLGAVLGLPVEQGHDAVFAVGRELDDGPALEAELGPVLVDEGHVGGEVVVHVELCTLRVEDLWVVLVCGESEWRGGLYGGVSCGHCGGCLS
jgi:hypothetical protein